jgi:DNA-3-methyladenine glycosylase
VKRLVHGSASSVSRSRQRRTGSDRRLQAHGTLDSSASRPERRNALPCVVDLSQPTPLPASFYEPSAEFVAPQLLGHFLLRRAPDGTWAGGPIVESEAYLANDPACHGFRRETARNRSMYGPPGRAYVYFIYGNYFCFNTVCARQGIAEAVLVRAIEPRVGAEWMQRNRPVSAVRELTAGPSKLCLALNIEREFDGVNLCTLNSELIVAENPDVKCFVRERGGITIATRIGLSVAAHMPLRFYLEGSEFVSKRSRGPA